MFNLIDKWLRKTPEENRDAEIARIDAPRFMSRRGFLTGLTTGLIGVSTGIIQPSRKILVSAPEVLGHFEACHLISMLDFPKDLSILGFTITYEENGFAFNDEHERRLSGDKS